MAQVSIIYGEEAVSVVIAPQDENESSEVIVVGEGAVATAPPIAVSDAAAELTAEKPVAVSTSAEMAGPMAGPLDAKIAGSSDACLCVTIPVAADGSWEMRIQLAPHAQAQTHAQAHGYARSQPPPPPLPPPQPAESALISPASTDLANEPPQPPPAPSAPSAPPSGLCASAFPREHNGAPTGWRGRGNRRGRLTNRAAAQTCELPLPPRRAGDDDYHCRDTPHDAHHHPQRSHGTDAAALSHSHGMESCGETYGGAEDGAWMPIESAMVDGDGVGASCVVNYLTPFTLNRNLPWQIYATRPIRSATPRIATPRDATLRDATPCDAASEMGRGLVSPAEPRTSHLPQSLPPSNPASNLASRGGFQDPLRQDLLRPDHPLRQDPRRTILRVRPDGPTASPRHRRLRPLDPLFVEPAVGTVPGGTHRREMPQGASVRAVRALSPRSPRAKLPPVPISLRDHPCY